MRNCKIALPSNLLHTVRRKNVIEEYFGETKINHEDKVSKSKPQVDVSECTSRICPVESSVKVSVLPNISPFQVFKLPFKSHLRDIFAK